jgi:hypothetical protein
MCFTFEVNKLLQNILSSCLLSKNIKIRIYITVILSVLYGCETWSLTLREERRLKVFQNRVLRRIFGPKRDGVTGEWRKLHHEVKGKVKLPRNRPEGPEGGQMYSSTLS